MTEGRGRRAPTVRLWLASLGGSLLIVLAFVAVQRLEIMAGLRSAERLVRVADEFPTRIVGFSHHLVAAFFLLTSARMHTAAAGVRLGLLVVAGAGLALAFDALGGARNPLALGAFYVTFIAHVFRDEIHFYRYYSRQAGRDVEPDAPALGWLQVAALGLLGAVLVPGLVSFAALGSNPALPRGRPEWLAFLEPVQAGRRGSMLDVFPDGWTWPGVGAALAAPFLAVLVVASGRVGTDWTRLWQQHGPVLFVLAGSVALTAAGLVLGAWLFNLVVLMHFVSWFLFTTARLRSVPAGGGPRAAPGPMAWLRGTVPGFWTLHVGLATAVLGLVVLDHVVLGHRPLAWGDHTVVNPLALLLSRDAFYAWTILHVALSWVPHR